MSKDEFIALLSMLIDTAILIVLLTARVAFGAIADAKKKMAGQ